MSPFAIEVDADLPVGDGLIRQVRKAAETCLAREGLDPPAELTVVLTDDERLRQLNRDFLGDDRPTDVLSFPTGEATPGAGCYLGDIAISIPMAQRQAEAGGHRLDQEVQLLVVHAVLHLLGYDHGRSSEGRLMWSRQADVLGELGLELDPPLQF